MKENKKCFVVCPIGAEGSDVREHSDKVLKFIIRPALEELGYDVERGDESTQSGSISKSIIQNLLTVDLIVADLTGHNPNVFYELAVRHATGKPFVQIIQKGQNIPFDIFDLRTIQYSLDLEGVDLAKDSIKSFVRTIEGSTSSHTPISEVSSLLKISVGENTADGSAVLINELQRIDETIKNLEHKLMGRIEQLLSSKQTGMTTEEKIGWTFFEKMMDNPNKSDEMIDMITKLGKIKGT